MEHLVGDHFFQETGCEGDHKDNNKTNMFAER